MKVKEMEDGKSAGSGEGTQQFNPRVNVRLLAEFKRWCALRGYTPTHIARVGMFAMMQMPDDDRDRMFAEFTHAWGDGLKDAGEDD